MIIDLAQLPEIRSKHQHQRIVFTGGCFDLFHEGHVEHLRFTKALGDIAVVGVVSDVRTRERKGVSRPFRTQAARLTVIDAIKYVDYSLILPMHNGDESSSAQIMQVLRPDIFVEHTTATHNWDEDQELLRRLGIELVIDTGAKLNSTTDLVSKIMQDVKTTT